VGALRAIWRNWSDGEPLDFEGQHYRFTLMTPNFTPEPIDSRPPPITIAAVGPAMMRVAGETCDGVRLHAFATRKYLENDVMPRLQRALTTGQQRREHFQVSGGGFVVTGPDDETVATMFDWVRMRIGFYGSTRAYWPVFAQHGLEDLGEKLNHMAKNNQWDAMTGEVSDDVVHLFAAVGRHDELKGAVEDRFGGISDAISDSASPELEGTLPPDLIQDIQQIPTPFRDFSVLSSRD
jgi:probable F420-dependent oxidoreductase